MDTGGRRLCAARRAPRESLRRRTVTSMHTATRPEALNLAFACGGIVTLTVILRVGMYLTNPTIAAVSRVRN